MLSYLWAISLGNSVSHWHHVGSSLTGGFHGLLVRDFYGLFCVGAFYGLAEHLVLCYFGAKVF
jgi:hypothetical protein